ncbi:MAG: glycine-rich domain-containing protein [Microbacteriaceae bacterium]
MKISTTWLRPAAAGATFGAAVVPLIAVGGFAQAASDVCAGEVSGAIEIATGVCQMAYTTHGSYTFTAPAGVAKLSAVVIGGGGGAGISYGQEGYGGGGGAVTYVDSVDTSAAVSVTVGAGGATFSDGESSSLNSVTAPGGFTVTGVNGGSSGASGDYVDGVSGFAGVSGYNGASGSGVGGFGGSTDSGDSTPQTVDGGLGLSLADVAPGSTLFGLSSDTDLYGAGGSLFRPQVEYPTSAPLVFSTLTTSLVPGSGGAVNNGTDGGADDELALPGADGAVFLRWAPVLAHTGAQVGGYLTAGSAALGLGAVAVVVGIVSRRSRKRSSEQD